jgi:transposase InsO family protein
VRELAAGGIPVAVTCRVSKIARQPYYRWLAAPVTAAELAQACRAIALFDAHRDDPEFGYRFLADEARDAGLSMADRTAWRICSAMGWWSAFGKKRGRNGKKAGPPVHDDLVRRDFTASAPNLLWLADITEHRTTEGKLYLCAVKDVCSNRIVGYPARPCICLMILLVRPLWYGKVTALSTADRSISCTAGRGRVIDSRTGSARSIEGTFVSV